jgi:L-ascorbate metabolism protein UlaG (beta-lactamase superfamily)
MPDLILPLAFQCFHERLQHSAGSKLRSHFIVQDKDPPHSGAVSFLLYNHNQDIGGYMEITWYGLSCFRLTERGMATVITDPYDHSAAGYVPLQLKADIVTISHDSPEHNYLEAIPGKPYVVSSPGEFEVGGVFITGIQLNPHHNKEDSQNTLYVFEFNSLTVAHLGDLNRVPSQTEVEAMGTVNIALVPVGGGRSLNAARAAEVINLLEPNIVIPMYYATPACTIPLDSLSKFLKEMGISEIATHASLKVNASALPEETQVIVLDYQSR